MDEIDNKRIELTKKHNEEIEYIKNGIKQMKIEELPQQFQEALMKEIEYSFNEKLKYYKTAMDKLDAEMPKKFY